MINHDQNREQEISWWYAEFMKKWPKLWYELEIIFSYINNEIFKNRRCKCLCLAYHTTSKKIFMANYFWYWFFAFCLFATERKRQLKSTFIFFGENSRNYHCSIDVFILRKVIRKMKRKDLFWTRGNIWWRSYKVWMERYRSFSISEAPWRGVTKEEDRR